MLSQRSKTKCKGKGEIQIALKDPVIKAVLEDPRRRVLTISDIDTLLEFQDSKYTQWYIERDVYGNIKQYEKDKQLTRLFAVVSRHKSNKNNQYEIAEYLFDNICPDSQD